ncbi:patellin-3-like [Chenopodium quinoa]|uniref:Patellin-3 n=1 Tax=Chenopodium quinoa TaxID=63459 RepID=A0A803MVV7_CHEQI|nr:patellin-3-like [Chenopodium quinoa]
MAEETTKQNTVTSTTNEQEVVVVTEDSINDVVAKYEDKDEKEKEKEKEEVVTETKAVVEDVTASNGKVDEDEEKEEVTTTDVKVADVVVADSNVDNETSKDDIGIYSENEKKALDELKQLIQNALNNHEFSDATLPPPLPQSLVEEGPTVVDREVEKKDVDEEEVKEAATTNEELQETVTKVSVNEDGTKTVEAIAETVTFEEQRTTPDESTQESSAPLSSPLADAEQEVKTPTEAIKEVAASLLPPEEVSIWGVPLLKDERTDTILWKFLRARDFKVVEAFAMIKSTIKWRKEFKIDELLEEDLGDDLEKAVFMHGFSKEGHPVCYNVYGAFQNKELYQKTFSDEEKRQKFLKWRIQFLEKSIRKLNFSHGGISTMVQVNDLKNSPGPGKWELRQATKQALQLLQDNYPEFVAKQVFINVPWWYVAVNKMISPFLTPRTKSKFVVAGPSKSAETLFSYIAPEQVPVQYGGFSKDGEFGSKDGATQIIVKPTCKETVEFAVTEACLLTWEVRVLGWEVSYGAEFVPNAKDNYTVIIQKMRKVGPTEETIISNSFKTSEPGKIVLTIDNSSSKKKRLLYRVKTEPSIDD